MKQIKNFDDLADEMGLKKKIAKAIFDDIEKLMEDIQDKDGAEFLAVSMYNIIQLKRKWLK